MSQQKLITAILALGALCACAKKDTTTTTSDSTVASSTATSMTDSSAASSSATTTPPAGLTDANILAKEHGGDSAEVAIATFARSNSRNPQVKSYASLLISDHGKGEREVEALAKKLSITPQAPADDTTAQETSHTIEHLRSLKGADLDTAFVAHEVADHQADIADANNEVAVAQNPEVKSLVQKSIPELQKHLDRALALQKKAP